MKKTSTICLTLGLGLLLLALASRADVIPTNVWADYKGAVTINGHPAPVGTVVNAYDADNVHCGAYIVGVSGSGNDSAGIYGFMHVYGDDDTSAAVDHGAEEGDSIFFEVNGAAATPTVVAGDVIWSASSQNDVDLAVTATVAFRVVDPPTAKAGQPGDTVRFEVGICNDGSGLDFYGISSMSDTSASPGWHTEDQDTLSYADPTDTVYVYFDAILSIWGGGIDDTTYTIEYTVFSHVDTTVKYQGSVDLVKSISGLGDGTWATLPDGFHLFQNYPNPFNPTTTVSFSLPSQTLVRMDIINVLGQRVDELDLGLMPAGTHDIEYNASNLASGVYFYRVVTEDGALSKKMVLVK